MRSEPTPPELWGRIERLYHSALERAENEREAFLSEACAGDEALRREVESLLRFDHRAERFIETPALEIAARASAEAGEETLIGKTLGHYRILSLLGEGGMGEVYLALDTRLERQVELKLLPAQFTQDADRLRRFIQEAKAASALNHPNIITIHEISATESVHYVATEYVAGRTLRQLMAGPLLGSGRAIEVTTQIANALAAAHAAVIVHRDIKPENVMIRPDGYLKVLDFGIAKLITGRRGDAATGRRGDQESWGEGEEALRNEIENLRVSASPRLPVSQSHTASGVVLGTAHYMSPEQARGLEVDERLDIFSLGLFVYEIIAGRRPFEGATRAEIILAVVEREPPPLDDDVPAALREIVSRALRKDRDERYQSVYKLLADLRQLRRELRTSGYLKHAFQPRAWSEATLITSSAGLDTSDQAFGAPTSVESGSTLVASGSRLVRLARVIKRRVWILPALLALGVAAWLVYLYMRPAQTAIDSLAVLPFVNPDPGANMDAIADAAEE